VTIAGEQALRDLIGDPLKLIAACWPHLSVYDKQAQVMRSVLENYRTVVPSANQMGKTKLTALTAITFFLSRQPCRVVATSASEAQLEKILWNEIRELVATSKIRLPLQVNHLQLRKIGRKGELLPLDYCVGQVTRSVESFQGHHLPNDRPRVLALFEESSGIADAFSDAAESWAHRMLCVGNPLSTSNFFYRRCKEGDKLDPTGGTKYLNKVIHLDGLDSPNVRIGLEFERLGIKKKPPILIPGLLTLEEYRQREASWDEVKRRTRLRGKFYEGQDALLYPMEWLDRAQEIGAGLEGATDRTPRAIGVDIATGGEDRTVWTVVDEQGVVEILAMNTPDTMEICGRTIAMLKKHRVMPGAVAIDAGGGGKPIYDRLVELGYQCRLVWFGESPGADAYDSEETHEMRQSYANRRAEMYGALRFLLDPGTNPKGFGLPPTASELRGDLAVMPIMYDSEGRMMLPPKDNRHGREGAVTIKSLLGRSPDHADSLVLAVWAMKNRNAFVDWRPTEETWKSVDDRAAELEKKMQELLGKI